MICGTSLQDNSYLGDLNIFKNLLLGFEGPILGICSGMQIVGSLFEDKLVENIEIGMIEVRTLESNELCEGKFPEGSGTGGPGGGKSEFVEAISTIKGLGAVKAENLYDSGFHTVEELKAASVEDVASVVGFTNLSASKVVSGAKEL